MTPAALLLGAVLSTTGCSDAVDPAADEQSVGTQQQPIVSVTCMLLGGPLLGYGCAVAFWTAVKEIYMDPRGLTITGRLLQHSLLPFPGPITSDEDTVSKVKLATEFHDFVKPEITKKTFHKRGNVYFASGDLHSAYRNCTVTVDGTLAEGGRDSTLKVVLEDRWDFKLEEIDWDDGLKKLLLTVGNDQAALDQTMGFIHPYDIRIEFEMNYELEN
jgi:hypothetical protein